ncbi:MAG: hypothetical protein IJR59_00980 [Firmicutes bacterium]|nr:hypothetical protein [Bacillota bacterium]
MKNPFYRLAGWVNLRILIMYLVIAGMFSVLVVHLYDLQITNGSYYNNEVKGTIIRDIVLTAPRGNIYDRYGRPLAVNSCAYTVNLDPSVNIDNINDVLLDLIDMLHKHNVTIETELPISPNLPHVFMFDGSPSLEKRWKRDMDFDDNITANDAFYKLRVMFDIDYDIDDEDCVELMAMRCALYQKRFSKYVPVTVASNVSEDVITLIREHSDRYPGVYVDVVTQREYPAGELVSHLLGYTGKITETELASLQQYGYTQNDIVGKDGIEKSFERELNGTDGIEYVEVDSLGRRINIIEDRTVEPVPGNNIFLTIDLEMQKKAMTALENALRNAQLNRINGSGKDSYGTLQVFSSMVKADTLHIDEVMEHNDSTKQGIIRNYILSVDKTARTDFALARQILIDGLERGNVYYKNVFLAMCEQGVITADDNFKRRVENGEIGSLQAVEMKMREGVITPQMTALDPCTGSVVITDIHTGDVIAAATYPSYDNNRLVNKMDNKYYMRLQNDPTTPLVYRPFTEPRAPGSTFKMITATAALQEGIITPNTYITDLGVFTSANKPYARCWIDSSGATHGAINVSTALEVSCNYFFYEASYRMGNARTGETQKGIDTLNKYMRAFGLDSPTGVEIYELYDALKNYPSNISGPEYKKYIYTARNPDIDPYELRWTDGDTIRTAIGQAFNNYTSAMLSKYVAVIANGGTRYSLHFMDNIRTADGTLKQSYIPVEEEHIDIAPQNLRAIHRGMLQVTKGSKGTLRRYFENFPIDVAAKSGTAQESSLRAEHTTFVAFAPYEKPEISVAVIIPFGTNDTGPAYQVGKDVIYGYLTKTSTPETAAGSIVTH